MNFCDECNKIVPDNEVKNLFNKGILKHVYTITVNLCQGGPGMIGYCPAAQTVWCGNIREPDEQEYFIYVTCGAK